MSSRLIRIGLPILIVLALAGGGVWWFTRRAQSTTAAATARTAEVTTITAITRVESSGTVQPMQSASLSWKTTGQIAAVNVKPGDKVRAGDVLMTLEPTSAPQNIIQAQADLISAQKALEALVHPSALDLANAQQAVVNAQKALDDKQRSLRNLLSPDIAYYEDQYQRAQQALTAAQQNAEVTNYATNLRAAEDALTNATNNLNKYKDLEARYPGYGQQHGNALENAQKAYDRAAQDYQSALYNFQQAQANAANALADKQTALNTAKANLEAAQAGPDALKRAQAEAEVAVAEANLAEAQQTLSDLQKGGNPDDVAAARARVLAAQANVEALRLVAPFDGEILAVNYLPGDLVDQAKIAVELANRSQLYVDVQVDETEVTRIQIGDPATLLLDALPGAEFTGVVDSINPQGKTVNGLVKYTVRVSLQPAADMPTLLGATANAAIVTDVQADVLAVPLEAVQSDEQGEFVNRINADGTRTRVDVRSGNLQDELVTVTGGLQKGDKIEVPAPRPSTGPGGPFGG